MSTQLTTAERDLLDVATDAMSKLVASRKKQPHVLRTAIPAKAHPYAAPDAYAKALEPLRAEVESHKPVIPAPVDPFDDPKYTGKPNSAPPDGYAIAIARDRQKKGQQ
jgi:hypothetical protein